MFTRLRQVGNPFPLGPSFSAAGVVSLEPTGSEVGFYFPTLGTIRDSNACPMQINLFLFSFHTDPGTGLPIIQETTLLGKSSATVVPVCPGSGVVGKQAFLAGRQPLPFLHLASISSLGEGGRWVPSSRVCLLARVRGLMFAAVVGSVRGYTLLLPSHHVV